MWLWPTSWIIQLFIVKWVGKISFMHPSFQARYIEYKAIEGKINYIESSLGN